MACQKENGGQISQKMGFLGPKKNLRMKNLKSKNCLKDLEIGKLFKKTEQG